MYLSDFQSAGEELFKTGLVSGSSGNLSIRIDHELIITRHGSCLSSLDQGDLVKTGIVKDDALTLQTSWELPVHRAIYTKTAALAVVHAHPLCAVTLTLDGPAAVYDIPVIGKQAGVVPGVMAEEISDALVNCSVVLVKGHGSFAVASTLHEACRITLDVEQECRKLCRQRGISPLTRVE